MIVVVIIGLLAAVSIPLYRRARLQADETSAIATVRTLVAAEETWKASHPDYSDLPGLVSAQPPYVTGFGTAFGSWYPKGRYYFYACNATTFYQQESQNYTIIADPTVKSPYPGARVFCATIDGVIKIENASYPNCTGNVVGE